MKHTVLAALLAATGAVSVQAQTFVDRARVISAEPQYETVQVPREECGTQWINEPRAAAQPVYNANGTSYGGAIIGGIAGAIVGNQVGKGHGREAATAAGAVVGALAGNHLGNRVNQQQVAGTDYEQREVRSCRTVMDTQQRANGYRVIYNYNGNQYSTVTREHPGNMLPVRVSVTPEPEYHRR